MSFYPPSDDNVYKDFFQSDNKAEVDKMAEEVCIKENKKTIVFERGNMIVSRYEPTNDITEPIEKIPKIKKIKRK